jgi:hypothetical protein
LRCYRYCSARHTFCAFWIPKYIEIHKC